MEGFSTGAQAACCFRCSASKRTPFFQTSKVIRQVFEPEEFAPAFTDEEIQKEKQFRARMAANAAKK